MRRDLGQMSLADGLVNQRAGRNGWLDRIDSIVDWPAVVKVLDGIYASDEGRPSYPLVTYVKLLLLQQWYGLSDPGLEEAVDTGANPRSRDNARPTPQFRIAGGLAAFA